MGAVGLIAIGVEITHASSPRRQRQRRRERPRPMSSQDASEGTALIVVDVLNRYEHPDAAPLRRSMARAIDPMRHVIDDARDAGAAVVYVNDNYGDWAAGREQLCE